MAERVELEALDLAALLCSRVCHDIISPVGAVINGLEVLDEDNSEEMRTFAFDLIRRSAAQASAKLQFARLAFGAAGSTGAEIDIGDAEKVATGYMKGEKATFSFETPRVLMGKNKVKLLLNLILLANAAVPRGGSDRGQGRRGGRGADLHPPLRRAQAPACRRRSRSWCPAISTASSIDAQAVQAYYAGALARASGMSVEAALDGADVVIKAVPAV